MSLIRFITSWSILGQFVEWFWKGMLQRHLGKLRQAKPSRKDYSHGVIL